MEATPGLLSAAVDALKTVLAFEHPADAVLHRFFREHAGLGQRDRGFIAELVYAAVRNLRLLETLIGSRHPRRIALAAAAIPQGRSLRQLEPLLREGETEWLAQLKAIDQATLPLPVQLSLPDWIWARLVAEMGEPDAALLGRALLAPAPLDLRVNTILAQRDEVLTALHAKGLQAEATRISPIGVRLRGKPALQSDPLFLEGKVEVQEEASQLLAFLVGPRRREMIVDFCAGSGGKTLALGALMRSEGRLYAFDTAQRRLANLKPRLKRSGLSNVHPELIDSEHDRRIRRLDGKIDRVLVDAPCSGLGTLRRNPDLKWRQTPQTVAELALKQRSILAAAARLLRPGGRLVYATCSLLREENEDIVGAFLDAASGFALEDAGPILRSQGIELGGGTYFRTLPHLHHVDGFFAAVLVRTG